MEWTHINESDNKCWYQYLFIKCVFEIFFFFLWNNKPQPTFQRNSTHAINRTIRNCKIKLWNLSGLIRWQHFFKMKRHYFLMTDNEHIEVKKKTIFTLFVETRHKPSFFFCAEQKHSIFTHCSFCFHFNQND